MSVARALLLLLVAFISLSHAPVHAQQTGREPVLLVASPAMNDPHFSETIVLVVFPPHGGPTGVVLNRRIELDWAEAFPDDEVLRARSDPVFVGGPVRMDMLWFLVRSPTAPPDGFPVLADLYLSTDAAFLDRLLVEKGKVERFFVGYSGWMPEQLEREIALGAWYVLPADLDTILDPDPDQLWRKLLARATAVET